MLFQEILGLFLETINSQELEQSLNFKQLILNLFNHTSHQKLIVY